MKKQFIVICSILLLFATISYASGLWDIPNLFIKTTGWLRPRGGESINVTGANITADNCFCSWNGSVNYYSITEVDTHIASNITGLNDSVKLWVYNGSFYLATEVDTHISSNVTAANTSMKAYVDAVNTSHETTYKHGNTTLEIEAVSYANVTNGEWITPSYVIDIDDEDIETDLNTYVDIAGDTMTGPLIQEVNSTFEGDKDTHYGQVEINNNLTAEADLNQGDTSNLLLFERFINGTHIIFKAYQDLQIILETYSPNGSSFSCSVNNTGGWNCI